MKTPILILTATILLGAPLLQAQSSSIKSTIAKRPFQDLGSVAVLVEQLGPDGEKAGITTAELKAFVELKLRQSGVSVRDMDEDTLESPYLYIHVNLLYVEEIKHFTYATKIGLTQRVILPRNEERVTATTWEKGAIAVVHRNKVREDVRESLDLLLTSFLNGYLAANQPRIKEP